MRIKKIIKYIFYILVIIFIVIQFFRPDKFSSNEITNEDITKNMQINENVMNILNCACMDCHSNKTKWPWYSNIAPVSWFVTHHVNEGREEMNFSTWSKYPKGKQEKKLLEICEMVTENEMPLTSYTILHSNAKLTQEDKDILCNWIKSLGIEEKEDEHEH